MQSVQETQVIRSGIRLEQRAGKPPSRMFPHLRFDRRIQILPVFRGPVAMNTCHRADRLVAVPADENPFGRLNNDLSFRFQTRQSLLDRPPGNTMFSNQFPDRAELLTARKMVQLLHQRIVKILDLPLNTARHRILRIILCSISGFFIIIS